MARNWLKIRFVYKLRRIEKSDATYYIELSIIVLAENCANLKNPSAANRPGRDATHIVQITPYKRSVVW